VSGIFEEITLGWDGKQYKIPANRVMAAIGVVEKHVTLGELAKWQADQEEGLQERLDMDPTTGEFAPDFGAKLQQYNSGDIDALNYAGAFKPAKFDEKFFSTQYGDANRYKSVPVSYETYKNTAMRNLMDAGLNERDARQQATVQANNYKQQMLEKGTPLRFKSDKWTPTKAWEDGNAAKISSKYIVDGFNALLDPKNTQIWSAPQQTTIDLGEKDESGNNKTVNLKKTTVQTADVLPDFSLGKKTITYKKQKAKYDKDGNPTGQEVEVVTEPVEDAIEPFVKMDGKVYMQTTANRLEGKPPFLLTDGAIDKTFAICTPIFHKLYLLHIAGHIGNGYYRALLGLLVGFNRGVSNLIILGDKCIVLLDLLGRFWRSYCV